jgi:hypothetical protein
MTTSLLTLPTRAAALAALLLASLALPTQADTFSRLAVSGDADPFGGPLSRNFRVLQFNDLAGGTFEDRTGSSGHQIIARVGGRLTRVVNTGMRMPDQGILDNIASSKANVAGQVVFRGHTDKGFGIFLWSRGIIRKISGDGTAFSTEVLRNFGDPVVNDRGDVAFAAQSFQGNVGTDGIFLASPSLNYLVRRVAKEDGPAPGGGTFDSLRSALAISQTPAGVPVVAFPADTTGGSGIYVGNAAALTLLTRDTPESGTVLQMNRVGQVVVETDFGITVGSLAGIAFTIGDQDVLPNGDTLRDVREPSLNDLGVVAFTGTTTNFDDGVFTATAAGIKIIKMEDSFGLVGGMTSPSRPQINSAGVVAFAGQLRKPSVFASALFLSDGVEVVPVISVGDTLLTDTVSNTTTPTFQPHSFNARGELAFTASISDGNAGLFLFTPHTDLRPGNDGVWDHAANWRLSILPSMISDVVLQSATDLQMLGPSKSTYLHSLTVGGGGGTVTLKLQPGTLLTTIKGTKILDGATLTGSINLVGSLTLAPNSRVLLTLGGKTRGLYDFLRVTGAVTLDGTLEVALAPGYTIPRDAIYDLLDVTRPAGAFATITLPPLVPAGLFWDNTRFNTLGILVASGATFFAQDAGVYSGLLQGAPATLKNVGSFALALVPNGGVRATIRYAGGSYIAIGRLELDGSAILKFGFPARQLVVQLDLAGHTGTMTGQVIENGATVSTVAAKAGPAVLPVGSPLIGHYTFALPADPAHPEATAPQGTGYGTITVSAAGLVRLVGVLGDGTAISAGGPLTAGGGFSVYAPLYGNTGYVNGTITLVSATAGTAFTGQLHWFKPPSNAALFGAGFSIDPTVIGSGYEGPPAHTILSFAGGHATFDATGAGLAMVPSEAITFDVNNRATADSGERFSLSFARTRYGLGSGFFLDAAGKLHTFTGVILQKQNEVLGLLPGTAQTGTVEVH